MSNRFVPLNQAASYNEVEPQKIKNLLYKETRLNDLRFKTDNNGKIIVALDYLYPLRDEIERLYYRALKVAKNDFALCRALAQMSGDKVDTIHKYFYRFNFKKYETSIKIKRLLEQYIKENSLFDSEDLDD